MSDAVADFRRTRVNELQSLIDACVETDVVPEHSIHDMIARVRELYFFAQDFRGMVEHVNDIAKRNNLVEWANGHGAMEALPWGRILDAGKRLLGEPPLHQRDWASGPIELQFRGAISGGVDILEWARLAKSGSPRRDRIDEGRILTGAVNLFEHLSTSMLNSLEEPVVRDFESIVNTIVNRPDASLAMLPAALTYFGANGLMVLNHWPSMQPQFLSKLQEFAAEGTFDVEVPAAGAQNVAGPPVPPAPSARNAGAPGLSLAKGGNTSLSKQAPNLTSVAVGLGWDARATDGREFDLDASAIACDATKKVISDEHFVFFNNMSTPDGSIVHTGDNRTGDGDGDDEVINVELVSVPAQITNVLFTVSIYDDTASGLTFGQVHNAYIRIVDRTTNRELARYDLSEDASTETAMVFGEIYRRDGEWKFRAIGQGYASGLAGIARDYGVDVE